jgi:hypothetical protein
LPASNVYSTWQYKSTTLDHQSGVPQDIIVLMYINCDRSALYCIQSRNIKVELSSPVQGSDKNEHQVLVQKVELSSPVQGSDKNEYQVFGSKG